MKKLVLILLVFVSVGAFAQVKTDTVEKSKAVRVGEQLAQHKNALIVRDGEIYAGKIDDLQTDSIQTITFVDAENAFKIYGPQAANGVFLLFTKKLIPDDSWVSPSGNEPQKKPLIILDGKIITYKQLTYINPKIVADINILNAKSGIAKYGKAAENGAMEVTTKAAAKKQKAIKN